MSYSEYEARLVREISHLEAQRDDLAAALDRVRALVAEWQVEGAKRTAGVLANTQCHRPARPGAARGDKAMTTDRQFADSEGDFKDWHECSVTNCRQCKSLRVRYRVWESSDGAYEDYQYRCSDCGHTWWVDGIDS